MEFELPPDFKEFLESLNRHEVRYLLIGGYAVGLHGHPRATNDIDIVVSDDPENAERLVTALREFGFGETSLSADLFTSKDALVVMGVEPLAIDILNYLQGAMFEAAYQNREIVSVEDIKVSLISLKDLIANKRAVARHKDLEDVEKLEKINR